MLWGHWKVQRVPRWICVFCCRGVYAHMCGSTCIYVEVKDRCWVSSSVTFYLSLETGSLIEAGAH